MVWFPKAKHLDRAMWNWLQWQRIVAAITGYRGDYLDPFTRSYTAGVLWDHMGALILSGIYATTGPIFRIQKPYQSYWILYGPVGAQKGQKGPNLLSDISGTLLCWFSGFESHLGKPFGSRWTPDVLYRHCLAYNWQHSALTPSQGSYNTLALNLANKT